MDFKALLNIIKQTGLEAKVVFQAIYDALEYVYNITIGNESMLEDLRDRYNYLYNTSEIDNSSSEVVGARGGRADLNTRLNEMETELQDIYDFIESQAPVIVTETKTEPIPFGRTIVTDPNLTPDQSKITTAGKLGTLTLSVRNEYINGVFQREISRTVTNRVEPVNEIYTQGTKATVANRPVRYIRYTSRVGGTSTGRWVELEVHNANGKITNSNTVVMVQKGKRMENGKAPLFDGAKQYWSTIISGTTSPYVQIDLGTARQDLTKISQTLYPGVNYDVLTIDVSSDNKTWHRVYSTTANNTTLGQEVSIAADVIYRVNPITTFTDTNAALPSVELSIGQMYTIVASSIPLYYDSYRAEARNISLGNPSYTGKGTHKILNKRLTANGDILYGMSIGWVYDKDNV